MVQKIYLGWVRQVCAMRRNRFTGEPKFAHAAGVSTARMLKADIKDAFDLLSHRNSVIFG